MKLQVQITFEANDIEDGEAIVKGILGILKEYKVNAKAGPVLDAIAAEKDLTVVYTDGGCDLKKDGIGAWAYVIQFPDGRVEEQSGVMIETTNNRMELMAVIKALESLEFGQPIKVVTDSEYVAKGVTQWSRNWVRNGWMTREGKPVLNRDLWEHLLQLYQLHAVTFETVKGHSGHPQNERCDALCTVAMIDAHKSVLAGESIEVDVCAKQVIPM